ncbi:hypothetical protein AVEN_181089-1 [Araneus ventricosus]|uniref:Uncharacterized protein n=1 Tax=Araneus ventricosus TaxID=182803 RepID=A0A4Y2J3B2_ARAVE|nr:hypothetical protein AVEN_181089-1 [Araneus ventricosus]
MIGEDLQKFFESPVMRSITIGRLPIWNLPNNSVRIKGTRLYATTRFYPKKSCYDPGDTYHRYATGEDTSVRKIYDYTRMSWGDYTR